MEQQPGTIRSYIPGPPLSELVDCIWSCRDYIQPHARERVLPTGTMGLVFAIDTDGRAVSAVAGARSECVVLDTSRPFSAIAVHFRPGGGFPFFGVAGSDLSNRNVALDAVWGACAARVRDRLWEAETPEARFRILEQTLLERLRGGFDRHPAVRYALEIFGRSNGAHTVGDVIDRIGLSPRRFADLFRREAGLSPKVFCRVRRFNRALAEIGRHGDVDWSEVALSCGYFDQSHFNHDFRAFSGLSPSSYLRLRTSPTHVKLG